MTVKLTDQEITQAVDALTDWSLRDEKLFRSFSFANFIDAFSFMTRVAIRAEKIDHHPEWFNVYDRVDISLTTHDVGGLSAKDLALAEAINREFAASAQ